jgi:hypothetical protein
VLGLGYVNTVDIHVTDPLVEQLGVFHDPILCARPFFDPGKRRSERSLGRRFVTL